MKLIQATMAWALGALAITVSPITAIARELPIVWANAQKTHFADGGIFDHIFLK